MTRDTNGKNVTRMQLQTRIRIKDALMQLLKEYSFGDITVKQIVLTAKISRPTFYRNYSSKKEVLDDAITDIMLDYKEKFNQKNITDLHGLLVYCFQYFGNNHDYISIMVGAHLTGYLSDKLTRQFAEGIQDNIRTWRQWQTPLQKQIGIHFAFYGFLNVIIYWIATGCKESPEAMAKQTIEIIKNLV